MRRLTIVQTSRFTVPELLLFSRFSSPRTRTLSPSFPTPATASRPALDVEVSVAVASVEDVAMLVEAAPVSRESARDVKHQVDFRPTHTTPAEAVEELVVDAVSDGRITTSHSATVMRLLTSSLTGGCWRRLILTA